MKNKIGIIIGCILLCILLGFLFFKGGQSLVGFVLGRDEQVQAEPIEEALTDEEGMLEVQEGERTNVLLLGIDARGGEEDARTDTMMLVSVDPDLKKAVIISIPRDTRVTIYGSEEKICVANVYGGTDLAKREVEELLHTHVDYYAKANFEGFEEIIDILGGVTIEVEQRMYRPSENIDLQPGLQTLNGRDALSYVRYRSYAMGDIDRTTHQQKFLTAVVDKVTQPSTLLKIPALLGAVRENVETDMPMSKMIQMASWAPLFDANSVVTQTLPGYFLDIRDAYGNLLNSYWEADSDILPHLLDDLYQGKTYDTVNQVGGVTEVVGGGVVSTPQEAPVVPEVVETDTNAPEENENLQEESGDPAHEGQPASTEDGPTLNDEGGEDLVLPNENETGDLNGGAAENIEAAEDAETESTETESTETENTETESTETESTETESTLRPEEVLPPDTVDNPSETNSAQEDPMESESTSKEEEVEMDPSYLFESSPEDTAPNSSEELQNDSTASETDQDEVVSPIPNLEDVQP